MKIHYKINPIEVDGDLINGLSIENNIFWENGTNRANVLGTPLSYVNKNNKVTSLDYINPGINFRLGTPSSVQNEGLNVGLTSDYDGNSIVCLPDIGAFVY